MDRSYRSITTPKTLPLSEASSLVRRNLPRRMSRQGDKHPLSTLLIVSTRDDAFPATEMDSGIKEITPRSIGPSEPKADPIAL